MKKLVLVAVMTILGMVAAFGQNSTMIVEGNVIKSVKASSHKADTLVTNYLYEDTKGNRYPIIINKNSGRCYIWRVSGKTGQIYKMPCGEEKSRYVSKQLGIEYKEYKKKEK